MSLGETEPDNPADVLLPDHIRNPDFQEYERFEGAVSAFVERAHEELRDA